MSVVRKAGPTSVDPKADRVSASHKVVLTLADHHPIAPRAASHTWAVVIFRGPDPHDPELRDLAARVPQLPASIVLTTSWQVEADPGRHDLAAIYVIVSNDPPPVEAHRLDRAPGHQPAPDLALRPALDLGPTWATLLVEASLHPRVT